MIGVTFRDFRVPYGSWSRQTYHALIGHVCDGDCREQEHHIPDKLDVSGVR